MNIIKIKNGIINSDQIYNATVTIWRIIGKIKRLLFYYPYLKICWSKLIPCIDKLAFEYY